MPSPKDLFDFAGSFIEPLFSRTETAWDLLPGIKPFLKEFVRPEIRGRVHPTAVVEGDVFLEEGVVVEPGAYIQGPCWIGRDSQVRQGAYIRGSVVVGARCVVGHATEVKNAIFLDDAKAGHFAYVGDCVLGRDVNLGAGTKLANFKLDAGNVSISIGGERIDTGLRKFGALLGDEVQTGCNSVTSPGTVMGRGCWVYANTTVPGGIYAAKTILASTGRRLVERKRH
jgi:UDP-N-acetylglucosamine diphosphorylase / glucose-1-phosphate thymidylyltransferase / UDP-N-acetylgalactosamine diphosphorylase / glucosamine-1-phosphate N-acetyltransferase / galactosamine-1-phosphate N-acetyltransferase